jgi:hypothetical protein
VSARKYYERSTYGLDTSTKLRIEIRRTSVCNGITSCYIHRRFRGQWYNSTMETMPQWCQSVQGVILHVSIPESHVSSAKPPLADDDFKILWCHFSSLNHLTGRERLQDLAHRHQVRPHINYMCRTLAKARPVRSGPDDANGRNDWTKWRLDDLKATRKAVLERTICLSQNWITKLPTRRTSQSIILITDMHNLHRATHKPGSHRDILQTSHKLR